MNTTENNKALFVEVMEEVFNKHNLELADRYYLEDYKQHNPNVPTGRAGFKAFFSGFMAAFPDLHATVEQVVAEGDLVSAIIRWTGTHTGNFQGLSPTGRPIEFKTADIFRVEGGKIAEHWDVVSNTEMLATLGLISFRDGPKKM